MKKGVFFTRFGNLRYLAPILREINPAIFDVVFDAAAAADVEVLEDLAARGMRLIPYEEDRTYTYDYILMDYCLSDTEMFRGAKNISPAKIIIYSHGTDRGMGVDENGDFFISANEMQLWWGSKEKIIYHDAKDIPCVAVMKNSKIESTWSGLHHFDDIVKLRHADKSCLKNAFFSALGKKEFIHSQLPFVVYYEDECNEDIVVADALYKLSKYCIVGIKPWYYGKYRALPHLFAFRGAGPVAQLGRFAADVVLSGPFSGIMTTSLMLGLRFIPVHTRMVHNLRKGERSTFAALLARQHPLYCCKRILDWWPAQDIQNTAGLMKRIGDAVEWKRYEKMLPALQRHALGRFRLEGAARHTAGLIEHIILKGTLLTRELKQLQNTSENFPKGFRL